MILFAQLTKASKPTTVEKLLSRINESGVRDQVVAALLNSNVDRSNHALSPIQGQETTSAAVRADSLRPSDRQPGFNHHDTEFDARHPLVSPLNMMAAAVAAEIVPSPQNSRPQIGCFFKNQVGRRGVVEVFEERLAKYFGNVSPLSSCRDRTLTFLTVQPLTQRSRRTGRCWPLNR